MLLRAILTISFIGRRVPLRVGRSFGAALGIVAWHLLRRERRKALTNIALAYPDWPRRQQRQTISRMFVHLGVSLFEIAWLANFNATVRERSTTVENAEPTLALVRAGRGVMAFTGHCGNWEWVAATVASLGIPLHALQRERGEGGLNEFITSLRARLGIRTIDRGSASAAREMIGALRNGGMLAFLLDQNIRAESVKVPFFGRPALTPIGPAKLAIRAEVPVVCIFIERNADGTHHVRFTDPIETKRTDDAIELTAAITREIERQIRRAPEQWVWMHERWKERPKWDVGVSPAS